MFLKMTADAKANATVRENLHKGVITCETRQICKQFIVSLVVHLTTWGLSCSHLTSCRPPCKYLTNGASECCIFNLNSSDKHCALESKVMTSKHHLDVFTCGLQQKSLRKKQITDITMQFDTSYSFISRFWSIFRTSKQCNMCNQSGSP